MSTFEETTSSQATSSRLYRAVWRWHFYAGLYVIPFLLMLAVIGLVMLYASSIESQFGKIYRVSPDGPKMTLETQAQAALKAVHDGVVSSYIAPRSPDLANIFAYLCDLFTRLANGHLAKDIDALMPWAYAARIKASQ